MFNSIKVNVLYPAATRVGSLAAGYLIGAGAAPDHAGLVGTGAAAAICLVVDFVLDWVQRNRGPKR